MFFMILLIAIGSLSSLGEIPPKEALKIAQALETMRTIRNALGTENLSETSQVKRKLDFYLLDSELLGLAKKQKLVPEKTEILNTLREWVEKPKSIENFPYNTADLATFLLADADPTTQEMYARLSGGSAVAAYKEWEKTDSLDRLLTLYPSFQFTGLEKTAFLGAFNRLVDAGRFQEALTLFKETSEENRSSIHTRLQALLAASSLEKRELAESLEKSLRESKESVEIAGKSVPVNEAIKLVKRRLASGNASPAEKEPLKKGADIKPKACTYFPPHRVISRFRFLDPQHLLLTLDTGVQVEWDIRRKGVALPENPNQESEVRSLLGDWTIALTEKGIRLQNPQKKDKLPVFPTGDTTFVEKIDQFSSFTMSEDEKHVAFTDWSAVKVFDVSTGQLIKAFPHHGLYGFRKLLFIPGTKKLVALRTGNLTASEVVTLDLESGNTTEVKLPMWPGEDVLWIKPDGTAIIGKPKGDLLWHTQNIFTVTPESERESYDARIQGWHVSHVPPIIAEHADRFAVLCRSFEREIQRNIYHFNIIDTASGDLLGRIPFNGVMRDGYVQLTPDAKLMGIVEESENSDVGQKVCVYELGPWEDPNRKRSSGSSTNQTTASGAKSLAH